jgi:hypothetical protein
VQTSVLIIYGICVRAQKTIKVTFLRLVLGMKHCWDFAFKETPFSLFMCSAVLTVYLLGVSILVTPFFCAPTIFASVIYSYVAESSFGAKENRCLQMPIPLTLFAAAPKSMREKGAPPFLWEAHAHVSAIHPRGA